MEGTCRLRLLGPVQVERDGERVGGFESRKALALLGYLAVHDGPIPREQLAELLWGDKPEARGRANLSWVLTRISSVLPGCLEADRHTVGFQQGSPYWLDTDAFEELETQGEPASLAAAVELYRGEFLEGLYLQGCPEFEIWLVGERERWSQRVAQVLGKLVTHHSRSGQVEQGLGYARRLLTLEPWREETHRQVMRLLAWSEGRGAALAQYETCCRILAEELGVEPAAETTRLYEQIRDGELEIAPAPPDRFPDLPVQPPSFLPDEEEPAERPVFVARHNLPAQLTSFVGRERETAEVVQLLETKRLLTLTGPPGTGKTRLGLRVAAEVLDQFQDGVFFVDLAPIRDPGLVATTIAQVLGIGGSGGQPLLDTLKKTLRHKHLLLLLDNFEQIVDAAPLVGELLSSSAGLKALVTSREVLRVYGEQEYPVPPLTLPDLDRAEPLLSLSQYEAVELFTRRARAVRPDFSLTEDNAPAVAEICVRLDGLPLAIELAAARSSVLSPEMMRRRLESRLRALTAGPRDLPARQRTLRGTIDWSFDLVDPPEKTLFARLAVFQGGRTVEAVEAVCSHGLTIEVLAGLESLLNKSLLRQDAGPDGEPRFVMLELIHEYAWERLKASGEAEELQQRHAEYFLALAERAAPELRGARQQHWFMRFRAEQDNLRTALAWSLGEGEAELALRLVGALRDFWFNDGHSAEGLRWAERTLESGTDAPPAARAGALNAAGCLSFDTGDYKKGKIYSREALAIYRELGDEVNTGWALVFLSSQFLGLPGGVKEGITLCQEGLALFRESGHRPGIMHALNVLGELGRVDGDYDLAQKAYEECLALSRETGYKLGEAIMLSNLGSVAQYRGLPGQAKTLYTESLAIWQESGDKKYLTMLFAVMAGPAAVHGYPQAAARLLGASEALLETMGIVIHAGERPNIDRHVAAVRGQLDEATFDAAWAEGRAMSFEQAVSYALEVGQLVPAEHPPGPVREPEVAVELSAFLEGEEDKVPRPVFVARERELAQLDGHLDQALSGQGRVVLVTGEAGQGKTALVQEFARRAQAAHPDLVVAGGNCNAHTGIGDPYLPFREILGLLTGDVQDRWAARAISQEQARRMWHILPLAVQALVEAGPDLIDLFVPGPALTRHAEAFTPWPGRAEWLPHLEELVQRRATSPGDPNLQRSALFEQYTRVLQALASQLPLLLVLDDLQWVDSGSISLLFHLGRQIEDSQILIVGAYRPTDVALGRCEERHPLEPVVNEFRRQFGDIEVDLGEAEDRQFVETLLDTEPNRLGDAFRQTLYQLTRGNPLFTVELLRGMQERGDLIQDEEGYWLEGPALDWETLPARVEAVIAERIDRLPVEWQAMLTTASVEGEEFTAEIVARVQAADERKIIRCLSGQLSKQHRLVVPHSLELLNPALSEANGGQRLSRYRFRHYLFQKYLYQRLDEVERVHLHQAMGQALETLYAERVSEITAQLARHFQAAGLTAKAVDYLLQAGDRARDLYAFQEAANYYQQALVLLREERAYERAARTLMKLGLTHHLAFDFQQAREAYGEGFALWQRAGASPSTPLPAPPHPLRFLWWEPVTLDPTMADETNSGGVIEQIFRGLVTLGTGLDVIPEVALSWQVLEGGRRYVFHLREDVTWSDGVPVTAGDFVYAWRRVLDPRLGSPVADYLYDIKGAQAYHQGGLTDADQIGVRALDDTTLEVELEGPTSYFPLLLARPPLFPVPRHVVEAHGEAWTELDYLVSYGPFRLERWQSYVSLRLVRDRTYRGQFPGNVEEVCLTLNMEPLARRLAMYDADELDILNLWPPSPEADQARQRYLDGYVSVPRPATQYVGFDTSQAPFDDARVRRAFAMAVNKEKLASTTSLGFYFPATGGFVPPEMPGHSPGIGLPYKPGEARRLLAEAGYPDGRDFPALEGWVVLQEEEMELYLTEQWHQNLGVDVTWKTFDWGPMLAGLDRDPPPLFRMGWRADYPDPDNMLRVGIRSHWVGWQNETFNGLVEKARRIANSEERMDSYQRADRILVEEAAIVPLNYVRENWLIKPWIRNHFSSNIFSPLFQHVIIEPH